MASIAILSGRLDLAKEAPRASEYPDTSRGWRALGRCCHILRISKWKWPWKSAEADGEGEVEKRSKWCPLFKRVSGETVGLRHTLCDRFHRAPAHAAAILLRERKKPSGPGTNPFLMFWLPCRQLTPDSTQLHRYHDGDWLRPGPRFFSTARRVCRCLQQALTLARAAKAGTHGRDRCGRSYENQKRGTPRTAPEEREKKPWCRCN